MLLEQMLLLFGFEFSTMSRALYVPQTLKKDHGIIDSNHVSVMCNITCMYLTMPHQISGRLIEL